MIPSLDTDIMNATFRLREMTAADGSIPSVSLIKTSSSHQNRA